MDAFCTVLTDDDALAALEPAWSALCSRLPDASPFQSPEWLLPWWRQFGTGRPRVAVLQRNDRVAGILPLYRLDQGTERKLLPLGAGLSDYCDVLLEPGLPPRAADRLVAASLGVDGPGALTSCDLSDVPAGSALGRVNAPGGWTATRSDGETCPVLAIAPGTRELREIVPSGMRRKIRMSRHRAERRGGAIIDTAAPDTMPRMFDDLIRLHATRWEVRGEKGVLADPRVQSFHRDAAPRLIASGALRLQALRIGGQLAAVFYLLLAGTERVLAYLGGFDPAFAYESPGTLLFAASIEDAIREGRREFHFLRGPEAYKHAWGAVDRLSMTVRLTPTRAS
jgi:CelD/BcsL family acetyltransferase involved in cellulose biosynthesis